MRAFAKLIVFCGLGLLCASRPVEANWYDFIEALSGPGPFKGRGIHRPFQAFPFEFCVADFKPSDPFGAIGRSQENPNPKVPCLYFEMGAFTAEPKPPRFPYRVDLDTTEFGASFQLRPQVDVGFGMGFYRFDTFLPDDKRQGLTTVTITPLRFVLKPLYFLPAAKGPKWGVLKLVVKETLIPRALSGTDFGTSAEVFQEDNDLVTSFALLIDVSALVRSR